MTSKLNIHPLRQGDLDGLCSIYAVFNAIRYVSKEDFMSVHDDYEGACRIFALPFEEGIATLDTVINGADVDTVINLLTFLRTKFKFFKFRQVKRKTDLFKLLDKGPVIVGFEGIDSHWSVMTNYDEKYFYLFDSSSYKKFKIEDVLIDSPEIDPEKVCISRPNIISITTS